MEFQFYWKARQKSYAMKHQHFLFLYLPLFVQQTLARRELKVSQEKQAHFINQV